MSPKLRAPIGLKTLGQTLSPIPFPKHQIQDAFQLLDLLNAIHFQGTTPEIKILDFSLPVARLITIL